MSWYWGMEDRKWQRSEAPAHSTFLDSFGAPGAAVTEEGRVVVAASMDECCETDQAETKGEEGLQRTEKDRRPRETLRDLHVALSEVLQLGHRGVQLHARLAVFGTQSLRSLALKSWRRRVVYRRLIREGPLELRC